MNQTDFERAKNLLLNPHFTIAEIGEELGFTSEQEFVTAFTGLYGASPQAFRDRLPGQSLPLK